MTAMSSTPHTTETQARLPAPSAPSLLSSERFDQLAAVWRARGCWLSLWSAEGRLQRLDREAGAFWAQLARPEGHFLKALGDHLADALHSWPQSALEGPLVLRPWGDGLAFFLLPFRVGNRLIGVAVGGFLTDTAFDEPALRLLNACGLDRPALESLAARIDRLRPAEESSVHEFFRLSLRQAQEAESAQRDIQSMSLNLETTYEELHLVYTISGKLSLAGDLPEVMRRVASEVCLASRVAAVAFVLRANEVFREEWLEACGWTRLSDRVVQVGDGAPSLESLERLAECLNLPTEDVPPHLLINQPEQMENLRWAARWLKHLVAIPLCLGGRLAGVMLALNCVDSGDFTSVDVQLLRAVGDRVALHLENHRLYGDLNDLLMGMLHSLVRSIDAKDPYTCGHSERVAYYGRRLARQAGLPAAVCERVYLAGLLHDVGKIGVPDAILRKKGRLTTEEFDFMKRHPEIGVRILSRVRQIQDLLPGVLHHHERYDGGGYPDGLSDERIPLFGRILCVADCFDAMTTHRTYRDALSLAQTLEELHRCAGTQFDPRLVETFLAMDAAELYRAAHSVAGTEDEMNYPVGVMAT